MGRDESAALDVYAKKGFNPRARMGRDGPAAANEQPAGSFNPRARMGRDEMAIQPEALATVSIHAPAWGATREKNDEQRDDKRFNPRARMGRDKGI